MKLTGSGFEQWLERELRLHVSSVQRSRRRAALPAYRSALGWGGQPSRTGAGILARCVAGVAAVVLTFGGGSALAMAATGSHSPGELVQNVAQMVAGCKDRVRADGQGTGVAADANTGAAGLSGNSRGIGQCVSSQLSHNKNGQAHQQANGVVDADVRRTASPVPTPGVHQDHGQGSGSASAAAPGQTGTGRGAGSSGSHGHHPTPSPHS